MLDSWLLLIAARFFWIAARRLQERECCAHEVRRRATLPVPLLRPIRFRRYLKAAGSLALLAIFALGACFAAVRPVMLRLGATREELAIDGRGSSTRIHPELQDLKVGDTISLVPVLAWGIINEIGGAMLPQSAMLEGLNRRAEESRQSVGSRRKRLSNTHRHASSWHLKQKTTTLLGGRGDYCGPQ